MMRHKATAGLLALALAALSAAPVQAQPRIQPPSGGPPAQSGSPAPQGGGGLIHGTSADNTVRVLQQAGYSKLEAVTVEGGQRHARGEAQGMTVLLLHFQCKNDSCASMTFYTSFGQQDSIDDKWINAWNTEKRFAKLNRTNRNEVVLSMDIHFFGGASQDYLKQSGVLYAGLLKALMEFQPSQ